MKTIIFDFMGIIADPNFKEIFLTSSAKEKIQALRFFVSLKKDKNLKSCFSNYQKGLIPFEKFQSDISATYSKEVPNIAKFLNKFVDSIRINFEVLNQIEVLKKYGYQVLLMSNTIPETSQLIYDFGLNNIFDGIILSTELGFKKPQPEIYYYAIEEYKLKTNNTILIDDTPKNLKTAKDFGIETINLKGSKQVEKKLAKFLEHLSKTKSENEFKI